MDIRDFFNFASKLSSSTVQAHAIELDIIPNPSGESSSNSDHNRLIYGDYKSLHFPILFKQESGKRWDDILDTGWPSLYLISDRLKRVLKENKLVGWKAFPIKLLDKKGNEIPGYHGFSITGHCGPIDYNKCEIFQKRLVEGGPIRNFYKVLYVGLDQWDGSDFFHPEGNLGIIVTVKAADILKKNKISNISLRNLSDIETLESVVKLLEEKGT